MWGKLVRVGWLTWLLLPHLYAEPRARKALVTTISSEQVAEALASRGVRVRPAQIQFLSAVPSTINPKLQMVSMGPTAFTSMSAKLRCSTGECLPFYVLLRGLTDIQDRDAAGPTTRVVPLGHALCWQR